MDSMTHPLRELVGKATPGPWRYEIEADPEYGDDPIIYVCHPQTVCDATTIAEMTWSAGQTQSERKANAALIVAMRNSIEFLLDEVEGLRIREEVATLASQQWQKACRQADNRALAAEARAKKLAEVMKPFAGEADRWHEMGDTRPIGGGDLTVADMRRARRALSSDAGER